MVLPMLIWLPFRSLAVVARDGSKGRDGLRHKADNHKIAERVVGQLGTEKNRRETLIGYIRNISWG